MESGAEGLEQGGLPKVDAAEDESAAPLITDGPAPVKLNTAAPGVTGAKRPEAGGPDTKGKKGGDMNAGERTGRSTAVGAGMNRGEAAGRLSSLGYGIRERLGAGRGKIRESGIRNILGLLLCVGLFVTGFSLHGNGALYFNLAGLLVVVGGTVGATLVSFRLERLAIVFKVLRASYGKRLKTPDEIVELLVDLSVKSKLQGILSLQDDEEETTVLFLRRALGLLMDQYPPKSTAQIRDLLHTEIYFFKVRREETERVLLFMAEICPSFGLVGSVVGLIGMLGGMGDTSVILATVPIALTSTMYGIIFANFFLYPFSVNIREMTARELLLQKIITEGVVAIGSDLHPRILEEKLKSFLTPSAREGQLVSLARIQEKFRAQAVMNSEAASEIIEGVQPQPAPPSGD